VTDLEASGDERLWRYRVERGTAAPPAVVWPLIGEAEKWREWSFMTRTYLLREGAADRKGVGALRRFAVGRFGSCEEVVEYEPPLHLGCVARKGIPVKAYRRDIRLAPDGAGTSITWTATMVPKIPGTGRLVLEYTHRNAKLFAKELVRHADRLVKVH
jgi:uncharacterized protein YndB with AHSA1/START domain